MPWIMFDGETASDCDLKVCGAHVYAEHPTTRMLCWCFENEFGIKTKWFPGQPIPLMVKVALNQGWTFIAHNAVFEKAIWREIMVPVWGWPPLNEALVECTLAVCAMKAIPQALEKAAMVLRLPVTKDLEGRKLTLSLSRPDRKTGMVDQSQKTLDRVAEYCARDVETEIALHHRIGSLPPDERNDYLLDQTINGRGLRLDRDFVDACERVVSAAIEPLAREFAYRTRSPKFPDGLAVGQRDEVLDWCRDRSVALPDLTKETVEEALGRDDDGSLAANDDWSQPLPLPPEVRRVLEVRSLINTSSVKKLKKMRECVSADGRARGLLQWHGTGPGRKAGRLLQPQNFPRGDLGFEFPVAPERVIEALMTGDAEVVEERLGEPINVVVSSLRYAIVPDPGKVFLSGDFAGIQARVLLALAGEEEIVTKMAQGHDIYLDMASAIYNRPITKADKNERQAGKNSVLGAGFGMGAKKFHAKYCGNQPPEFAKLSIDTYRETFAPRVPKLWRGLHAAATKAVHSGKTTQAYGVEYVLENGWLTARLPSGRQIWYFDPRPCHEPMPWDETDIRPSYTYWAQKAGQWKEIKAFGGLATENVVMGIEADLMRAASARLEAEGFPLVLEVHDELVAEVEEENADLKAFLQVMEEAPAWAKALKIPIAVEGWAGVRYQKV